jgi:hypothetical protein
MSTSQYDQHLQDRHDTLKHETVPFSLNHYVNEMCYSMAFTCYVNVKLRNHSLMELSPS